MSSNLATLPVAPALRRVVPPEPAAVRPISATVAARAADPFFVEVRSDHAREVALLIRQGMVMFILGLFILLRAAVL